MGVDGFSMASVGMPKDITSAQAAATTEQQVFGAEEKVVNKIDRALNKRINNDEEKEHKNKKDIKLFDPLETIKEATDEFGSSSNISTGGIERFSFKPNIKNEEDKTHKPNRKKTPIKKKKENKFTFII